MCYCLYLLKKTELHKLYFLSVFGPRESKSIKRAKTCRPFRLCHPLSNPRESKREIKYTTLFFTYFWKTWLFFTTLAIFILFTLMRLASARKKQWKKVENGRKLRINNNGRNLQDGHWLYHAVTQGISRKIIVLDPSKIPVCLPTNLQVLRWL